jgi:hypothetical protein
LLSFGSLLLKDVAYDTDLAQLALDRLRQSFDTYGLSTNMVDILKPPAIFLAIGSVILIKPE